MSFNDKCLPVSSADRMKSWDAFTILTEPISSIKLMERASSKCVDCLLDKFPNQKLFDVFCGTGNNGGDGLAIARLLANAGKQVNVWYCGNIKDASPDNLINWEKFCGNKYIISSIDDLPKSNSASILIDALFGMGISRPVKGLTAECIHWINTNSSCTVSIDLPSGLYASSPNAYTDAIVKAHYTLTFQSPKMSLLFPECELYCGQWVILDIGLSKDFSPSLPDQKFLLTEAAIKSIVNKGSKFDHKGKNGHALLVAGSETKYGAAILAVRAALRSGTGLLTIHVPHKAELIFQTACPEAMLSLDKNDMVVSAVECKEAYTSIGVGPGLSTSDETAEALKELLTSSKQKMVLDADALNILSGHQDWLSLLPQNAILTPHLKEFERLCGKAENAFHRHQMQIDFSKKHQVFVLLKGAYSCLSTPEGDCYFNSTGNQGMAKGGSGDVLTGVITSLLAQHYSAFHAALMGMYVHGKAGDLAAEKLGMLSMNASDIIDHLPEAFQSMI